MLLGWVHLGVPKALPSALKCMDDSWNPILAGLEAWAGNTGFSSFIIVFLSAFFSLDDSGVTQSVFTVGCPTVFCEASKTVA